MSEDKNQNYLGMMIFTIVAIASAMLGLFYDDILDLNKKGF